MNDMPYFASDEMNPSSDEGVTNLTEPLHPPKGEEYPSDRTCIAFTHGHRMLGILKNLGLPTKLTGGAKIKFQNCSIVKLELNKHNGVIYPISCEVYYGGPYKDDPHIPEQLKHQDVDMYNELIKNEIRGKHSTVSSNQIVVYLVRHGHATHTSDKDWLVKVRRLAGMVGSLAGVIKGKHIINGNNTHLTDRGMKEAYKCGRDLHGRLPLPNIKHIFISDLVRTTETLYMIYAGYYGIDLYNSNPNITLLKVLSIPGWTSPPLIVTPCLHENPAKTEYEKPRLAEFKTPLYDENNSDMVEVDPGSLSTLLGIRKPCLTVGKKLFEGICERNKCREVTHEEWGAKISSESSKDDYEWLVPVPDTSQPGTGTGTGTDLAWSTDMEEATQFMAYSINLNVDWQGYKTFYKDYRNCGWYSIARSHCRNNPYGPLSFMCQHMDDRAIARGGSRHGRKRRKTRKSSKRRYNRKKKSKTKRKKSKKKRTKRRKQNSKKR